MNELTQNELTKDECIVVDEAFNNVGKSYLDCCIVIAGLEQKQEAIATRRNMARSSIARMCVVGQRSDKFIRTTNNLPDGWQSLYDLSCLPVEEISDLCKGEKPPTQKQIKTRKIELGLLPGPDPDPVAPTVETGSVLQKLAMLIPARTLDGLSDFGIHALEKESDKIIGLMDNATKTISKEVMTLFVEILKYQQVVFNAQLRVEARKAVKERKEEMDAREKKLIARETAIEQGLPIKDKRLIQSVLHPDKAPHGQEARYARAFDAFRKVV